MLTPLAMFGWIPFVVALFLIMPPKRAVLWAFFLAWLFLPMAKYDVPRLPDYTKMSATAYGVMIGVILFDFGRLAMFRPKLIDLPIVVFCIITPVVTAYTNRPELKLYDGLSEVMALSTAWLLPYFIGRLYFTDLKDMKLLAMCFLAGALAYVPICWFEARFSPQLHRILYGFHQHHFVHALRGGGYRPRGFMQSGLMTATWMCSAALIAWCIWKSKATMQLGQYRASAFWVLVILGITAVLCKGLGALLLACGGFGMLLATRWINTRLFMILLLSIVPMFILTRVQGVWDGTTIIAFFEKISEDRAQSLGFRFKNDTLLSEKALQRPAFGWGGYGRNLVRSQDGGKVAITDGMWILLLGKMGFIGLFSFVLALAMPTILFVKRFPPRMWLSPAVAPATGLATVLALYQIDNLFNAMENPLYFFIAGGMCSAMTTTMLVARKTEPAFVANNDKDPGQDQGQDQGQGDDPHHPTAPVQPTPEPPASSPHLGFGPAASPARSRPDPA